MKSYQEYKDSSVEWIGKIPEGWGVKRLKYLASISPSNIDKKSKDSEKKVFLCNYVNVYKNEFITDIMDFMPSTASESQIGKFSLIKNDVIITKDSEDPSDIAVPALVKQNLKDVVCGYHLTLLRTDPEQLSGGFLFWLFSSNKVRNYFETEAKGITRYGLGTYSIENISIIRPSLPEQIAIANYLDRKTAEIDQVIDNKKRLIALYEEEKTAVINYAITKGLDPDTPMEPSGIDWLGDIPEHWKTRKLRYLFEIKKRIAGELGHDVLSITQQGIKIKDIENMGGQISSDYSKYQLVEKGDFAMNHMDLLTGYVDISNCDGVTSPDYRVFSLLDQNKNEKYFLYLFQIGYKNKIFYAFGRGAAQFGRWRFPTEEFKAFEFPLPPKEEQDSIVQHIETECIRLNTIIEKFKKQIELLKEYRTTLISEVVTGKIDVRDEVVQ